jgi:hypothetical protein
LGERSFAREVERNLAAVVGGTDVDPKVQVILHYLREQNWLERNGAIIFSQYRTTAEWVLEALCAAFPNEPVALYAGGAASFVQRGEDRRTASREQIKGANGRSVDTQCVKHPERANNNRQEDNQNCAHDISSLEAIGRHLAKSPRT